MAFSAAQYTAAIDKLNAKSETLSQKLNKVGPTAESTANKWYVPGFIAKALIWCANKIIELGNWIWKKIVECLKGAAVPITAFFDAHDWQVKVRGKASEVGGATAPDALTSPKNWTGDGATAYTTAVKSQPTAATSIETSADKVAGALTFSAVAGLAFYVALGVILVKFIAATIAAIAALGSVVFSWAGAAVIVEEAGVNSALIITAVTTLTAALGTQAQQMMVVEGEARDGTAFPGGHWPKATA
ncbi:MULTISPECIES: hypothetical protein [Streptomyces]|uniref:Uncharacterized protein n=2 Tax=Streptomyces malaysiensis TaxID=92644 RepID=A0ABX6WBQ9_STRMQ|nr:MULTISPECIES: hypothetical protein [Streptomyces]MCC4321092.1 hypothetical protein [Streptomyces malaysiensis]MCM3812713.1 hypothetical protein [Streptomyces sp. DR7-3]NIY68679.1 hypothetical protein [Streptomyces malaysiensis]QPI58890.1 hypothetical protein I1A49_31920 [Streptomyces solisilvae]UHH20525.1 hypothetical protein LUV23_32120 [Streptomyces sp. HNM0561]